MLNRKQKLFVLKFFSLFSVVRGYNILIIVIAQYLTSIYILAPDLPVRQVLFDVNLLMLVLASSSAIAGGYIINSFYDSEKDLIPIIVGRNKIQGKHFIFLYFRALSCFEFVIITKILGTESMINHIKVKLLGLLTMFISAIEAFQSTH